MGVQRESGIAWTDRTWNIVTGCTKVSEGCRNCYAEVMAKRTFGRLYRPVLAASGKSLDTISTSHHEDYLEIGLARPRRFTDVLRHDDRLDAPLRWRKPTRVFVNSMSDLFHPDVPDEFIDRVFAVMALCRQHTFQILTKRPERMRAYLSQTTGPDNVLVRVIRAAQQMAKPDRYKHAEAFGWPYRNVWLGVSVEDQRTADERIPLLLQTPAAVRFVSAEPLLGPVDLRRYIGYNPMYARTQQRSRDLQRCADGAAADRPGRVNLEGRGTQGEPMERSAVAETHRSKASGEPGDAVLAGQVDDRSEAHSLPCAPARLASLPRTYPSGDAGQSPERRQAGQPAREPGTDDTEREQEALVSHRDERPVWAEEPSGHSYGLAGCGDSDDVLVGRQDAGADRASVRSVPPGDLESGQGRQARVTEGTDCGLHTSPPAGATATRFAHGPIHLVIVGGESGPKARPCNVAWVRSVVQQCKAAGVPVFVKQDSGPRPGQQGRIPDDLWVKEYPRA